MQYLGRVHSALETTMERLAKEKIKRNAIDENATMQIYYLFKYDGRFSNCVLRLGSNTKFYDQKWFKRKESIGVNSRQKKDVLHSISSRIKNQ